MKKFELLIKLTYNFEQLTYNFFKRTSYSYKIKSTLLWIILIFFFVSKICIKAFKKKNLQYPHVLWTVGTDLLQRETNSTSRLK